MTAPKIPRPVSEPTPDWEEVRQQDDVLMHVVPVDVKGIVATWSLPAKRSTMQIININTLAAMNQPIELIPADPRMKRAIITASTAFTIGTREQIQAVNGGQGFNVPANTLFTLEGVNDPIVGIAAAPVAVSVRYEYWSD
jgi:hypothetical protein